MAFAEKWLKLVKGEVTFTSTKERFIQDGRNSVFDVNLPFCPWLELYC